MSEETTGSWASSLKSLDPDLLQLDSIPQISKSLPPFDLKEWEDALATAWQQPLSLTLGEWQWKSAADMDSIFSSCQSVPITLSPLDGHFMLGLSSVDFHSILHKLFIEEGSIDFNNPLIFEPFSAYALAKALQSLSKLPFFTQFSPAMGAIDSVTVKEPCLHAPLHLRLENGNDQDRYVINLAIPHSLRESLSARFSSKPVPYLPQEKWDKTEIELTACVGKTQLQMSQVQALQAGDFVLLDEFEGNFGSNEQQVKIYVDDKPLFIGNHRDGLVTIQKTS